MNSEERRKGETHRNSECRASHRTFHSVPPPFPHRHDAGGGRRSNHLSNHRMTSNHLSAHSLAQPPTRNHPTPRLPFVEEGRNSNTRAPTQGCMSARTVTCHFQFHPLLRANQRHITCCMGRVQASVKTVGVVCATRWLCSVIP